MVHRITITYTQLRTIKLNKHQNNEGEQNLYPSTKTYNHTDYNIYKKTHVFQTAAIVWRYSEVFLVHQVAGEALKRQPLHLAIIHVRLVSLYRQTTKQSQ